MKRRKELTEEELKIIKKTINDDEAFEKFFRNCYLKNLRPATVGYYKEDIRENKIIIRRTKNLFERTVYLSETTQEQLRRHITIRGDVETKKIVHQS